MSNISNWNQSDNLDWEGIGVYFTSLGWSIIPIGDNKKPLLAWKKYQTNIATADEISQWSANPKLKGWAVVTGEISNLMVLDIDEGSEFDESSLPDTLSSITGSGGKHYFFAYPKGKKLSNTAGFVKNTDIRADGGYAVLPPSTHPNGNTYEWINDPFSIQPANPPQSLLDQLKHSKKKNGLKVTSEDNIFVGVAESKRNESAARVIGAQLTRYPSSEWESVVWPLTKAWNQQNTPPLSTSELRSVFDSISQREEQDGKTSEDNDENRNQAQMLVDMVLDSNSKLFINQFKEPCISEPKCPFLVHKISSKYCKMLLYELFWSEYENAPSTDSVNRAINTLSGIATFKREQETVYTRVARVDGVIFYDIGDKKHIIKVTNDGWSIENSCPVKFRHYSHQQEQVLPQTGGKLSDFAEFINVVEEEHRLLILTYLCVAFIPDIPRALLALHGDQGSSKSTLLKMLRSLIDPSQIPLLPPPNDQNMLVQNAAHHYAFFLDNLSHIREWFSDGLCRLVTGDGFSKRQLYTDDEDVLYQYHRVAGMTGVNLVATKPDLLDRSIIIPLERISDAERLEEIEIWNKFDRIKPQLLGAIFDAVSLCLRLAHQIHLTNKPRMADYFKYCVVVAQSLGYSQEQLTLAFRANAKQQNQEALDASPVGLTVLEFMSDKREWFGSSTELYQELEKIADDMKLKRKFPKAPNWLWRKIKEIRSNLVAYGINAHREREEQANQIKLTKNASSASNASSDQSTEPPQDTGSTGSNGSISTQPLLVDARTENAATFEIQDEEEV